MDVRKPFSDVAVGWPSARAAQTIPSNPPSLRARMGDARSRWSMTLAECRGFPGEWRMVGRVFTEKTARQIASDLRRAHARSTVRVAGVLPTDRWESVPGQTPEEEGSASFRIWLRYVGPVAQRSEKRRPRR